MMIIYTIPGYVTGTGSISRNSLRGVNYCEPVEVELLAVVVPALVEALLGLK
jgi:hypothetical protein